MCISRFSNYNEALLYELLYQDYLLVDGFDKEACVFESNEWCNFNQVRKEMIKTDISVMRYRRTIDALSYLDEVHQYVRTHPHTNSRDQQIRGEVKGKWGSSNLFNCALNHLWCKGDIGISARKGSIKYYSDITQTLALPPSKDPFYDLSQFMEWYVMRRLDALGLYWLKKGAG